MFEQLSVDLRMIISSFPAGTYMITARFYDHIDENILTIKLVLEIISKDRKEFK